MRRRYLRRSVYWTPAELVGAIVCAIGGVLLLGLMYRVGLAWAIPFVMVAIAGGWAWAAQGGSSRSLPPPPVEPAMRPRPPGPRSQAWWSDRR